MYICYVCGGVVQVRGVHCALFVVFSHAAHWFTSNALTSTHARISTTVVCVF